MCKQDLQSRTGELDAPLPAEQLLHGGHDAAGLEPESLLQLLEGGGRAERLHPDDGSRVADVPFPNVDACSIARRAFTEGGSTLSRYSFG